MKILDHSFETPEQNLALDEALLERSERSDGGEVLRFWEPRSHFVVLGYSNAWKREVRLNGGGAASVPVLRRPSGGGAVLQGPGCLNYALVLEIRPGTPTAGVVSANGHVMQRHRAVLEGLLARSVEVQGSTDLTLADLKFSGNSQRRKKNFLLFHGTFLLDLDLALVEEYLAMPSKEPPYRNGRAHRAFVTNVPVSRETLKRALARAWNAEGRAAAPLDETARLAREKYSRLEWNLQR